MTSASGEAAAPKGAGEVLLGRPSSCLLFCLGNHREVSGHGAAELIKNNKATDESPASLSLALVGTLWPGGHHTDTEASKMGKLSTDWHQEAGKWLPLPPSCRGTRGKEASLLPWLHVPVFRALDLV